MDVRNLLAALRRTAIDNHRCFGCGYEHNCSIHGCAINREAAELIKALQAEIVDERHRHDRYVDFELAQAKELERVKTENAALRGALRLSNVKTYELVEELSNREGVETHTAEPYQDVTVSVNGPAVVLVVID